MNLSNEIIAHLISEGFISSNSELVSSVGVGGGCISDGSILKVKDGKEIKKFFLKRNTSTNYPIFTAEAFALNIMNAALAEDSDKLRMPKALVWGKKSQDSYIVLEALEMRANSGSVAQRKLGLGIAAMHSKTAKNAKYGFAQDNFIGSTVQINTPCDSWAEFFTDRRLKFQIDLAQKRGLGLEVGFIKNFLDAAYKLLEERQPRASLLHGDLWGGNAASLANSSPCVFDPATYYGDRETDIAFTEVFGGFGSAFHQAYEEIFPLDSGYQRRKTLYKLYHILNHFNIFGSSYAGQAISMMREFC